MEPVFFKNLGCIFIKGCHGLDRQVIRRLRCRLHPCCRAYDPYTQRLCEDQGIALFAAAVGKYTVRMDNSRNRKAVFYIMKLAAAQALAELVGDALSADYIIPEAFDPRAAQAVAQAVAQAARQSGVARI